MGLLEIFNSVFFVPNFQLPNALVTAAARLGCVSEVKRETSLWIPDSEFPMLNITLRFNQEWEMGFKKRWEKESTTWTTSKRAERLAGMCLLSGESASPPFCWAGENCSGFMFDVRAEELWDSYLRSAAAGGSESGFFRTACQSQAPGTRSFLQEEAGVRRGKDWDWGRRRELWVCLRVSVAAAKVTLDHCNWRPLIDLSQQMMCRQEWCFGFYFIHLTLFWTLAPHTLFKFDMKSPVIVHNLCKLFKKKSYTLTFSAS